MGAKLVVGWSTARELGHSAGHTAATLYVSGRAINLESSGSGGGIRVGSSARGATNPLFRHRAYISLTEEQARKAYAYAARHAGERYRWGGVTPPSGADCSGFISGVYCQAKGRTPVRVFATGNASSALPALGFHSGSGPAYSAPSAPKLTDAQKATLKAQAATGKAEFHFTLKKGTSHTTTTLLMQYRLNVLGLLGSQYCSGGFGAHTDAVVRSYQRRNHLTVDGQVGPNTWRKLFPR